MIIYGEYDYGRVDRVPGLLFVKTRFLHVCFFPVAPLESRVFLETGAMVGIRTERRIPFRWKSIFIAWARAVLWMLTITIIIGGGSQVAQEPEPYDKDHPAVAGLIMLGMALLTGGLLWLTYRFGRANLNRALELGQYLGVRPEEVQAAFEVDALPKSDDTE